MSVLYSNNLKNSVKTFCCECNKVVTLTGLKEHILSHNKMTVKDYKQLYGNPRTQIIQLAYHKCGLCKKDVLLDSSTIEQHFSKFHQMEFAAYFTKFLSVLPMEKNEVIIRCDQCSKTFKRNIQLRAHSKRHQLSDIRDVELHGFNSVEPMKKGLGLNKLIQTFETAINREKQAFNQFLKLTY